MATKWGIVGTGKICNDFVTALSLLPNDEHEVIAVGASTQARAEEFGEKFNIKTRYDSYFKLANDPDIEVVYIGVINTKHFETAKLMLEKGKHVLCEKPLCMNAQQVKELVKLSKVKKLFLMEAIWSRFFPVYTEVNKILASKDIGEIMHLSVNFGVEMSEKDRIRLKELGGGTILDIGVYALQLALLVFDSNPLEVVGVGHLNQEGVDESVLYSLKYKGGKTASMTTHSKVTLINSATLYGTQGTVEIRDPFWCPTELKTPSGVMSFPLPPTDKTFFYRNSAGLCYEAAEVRACIQENMIESQSMTHKDSVHIATLQDKIRKDVGVIYPDDNFS